MYIGLERLVLVLALLVLTIHWLFGTDFKLWPKICLQRNVITTTRKKLIYLQGLPYMPLNLVNFGPQTVENGWRVFAHVPHQVCAKDDLQANIYDTFRFNHVLQMAPMVDAYAKSIVSVGEAARRAGSRWPLPCISLGHNSIVKVAYKGRLKT